MLLPTVEALEEGLLAAQGALGDNRLAFVEDPAVNRTDGGVQIRSEEVAREISIRPDGRCVHSGDGGVVPFVRFQES